MLEQMRRGLAELQSFDNDAGTVTRRVKADNGMGDLIPTGETYPPHTVMCRVSYQSGGVWPLKPWEGGGTIDTTPYVLAAYDADLQMDDMLEWRGKKYTVGPVSRPSIDGGATCTQAPLTEVTV